MRVKRDGTDDEGNPGDRVATLRYPAAWTQWEEFCLKFCKNLPPCNHCFAHLAGEIFVVLCFISFSLSLSHGSIGDIFGEMALMLEQPRSATVVCTSEDTGCGEGLCVLNEIKGGDFMRMLRQSDGFLKTMKVIMRTRLFR